MTLVEHKKGATFVARGLHRDAAGTPVDLTAYTIESQVRARGGLLIETLAVTKGDQLTAPGSFTVRAEAAQTVDWPSGDVEWDVMFTGPDGVSITDTVPLRITRSATVKA